MTAQTILPANSVVDTGIVTNSCRFDDASSDTMTRDNGTPTSLRIFAISLWFKRTEPGLNKYLITGFDDEDNRALLQFSSDQLLFQNATGGTNNTVIKSNAVFLDPSAWYHFCIIVDTTQSTNTNRVKMYVNGLQITSLASSTYPDQNTDLELTDAANSILLNQKGDGSDYNSGYYSEVVVLDGTAASITDFGEFDSDTPSVWKPIDVSGLTFGNNGFYLDFEDSANLGNDANGGTDFTEANLTAIDQTTDTCVNNFCTMNPLGSGAVTFSEGNLQVTKAGNGFLNAIAGIGASSGKWYAEAKALSIGSVTYGSYIGFINLDVANKQNTTGDIGDSPIGSAGISSGGGYIYYNGTQFTGSTTATTNNDIVNLAMDLDNGRLYWGINGTYLNSGDPASGATGTGGMPIANIVAGGTYTFAVSLRNGANYSWNFGSPNHTISSGNTDGAGFGNFEYAPPSGYFALCTKNLAEYG